MVKKLRIDEANKGYSAKVYDALQADFADSDGTVDPVYLSDQVELWLMNTKKIYDQMFNNRRKSYSVAYEAMLDLFQDVADRYDTGVRVTSEMAKRWLSKNGMDYKEVLKPVIAKIDEEKEERKNESVSEGYNNDWWNDDPEFDTDNLRTVSDDGITATDNTLTIWSKGKWEIIVDGYGLGITDGWSVERPMIYDDHTVAYSGDALNVPPFVKRQFEKMASTGRLDKYSRRNWRRESLSIKEARSGRKTYTQRQLKDMVRSGKAIDVTTYSFDDANELWERGYEVVGISRGVYGLNGALLKMNDTGELCAITARNSTLLQLV